MGWHLLAVDPGTDKVGLAVLSDDGTVLYRRVVPVAEIFFEVDKLAKLHRPKVLLMGNGTGAKTLRAEIEKRKLLGGECKIILVDEYRTSEEARRLYLTQHRHGWRKFLPLGLQTPPEAYDDYVAVILGKRYLEIHKQR